MKTKWDSKEDANDSKSTELWNKYYDEIMDLSKIYSGEFFNLC